MITSVGMEVHAELLTKTKMFCRCANAFGGEVNTRVCPVCLGLPGTLPIINRLAVELVLRTSLALNCKIAMKSFFHRKNYFYPDLPKGYQVSQYGETNPLGYHGWLDIPGERINIARVHLEEDTGKLMHLPGGGSGVDLNRAGVPLMEIVTAFPPDIHSGETAKEYLTFLRLTLIYLGVCDGKMEHGSMRCEPNISIAPEGSEKLGTKAELKNLGSFRSVVLGIAHESERMKTALDAGQTLRQETRGWNETSEMSYPMRVKEMENDYRYFIDPDLPPMEFSEEYIESLRAGLPELPLHKRNRYMDTLGLSEYDAGLLISEPTWAEYFDRTISLGVEPKLACNWMNGEFARLLNETGLLAENSKVTPEHIMDIVQLITAGDINGKQAKEVFEKCFATGEMPSAIVQRDELSQISDNSVIHELVVKVLTENPDAVQKFKDGKINLKGFLIGQVMKESKGRANPELVNEIISEKLKS